MPGDIGLVPALDNIYYPQGRVYTRQETDARIASGSGTPAPQGAIFKVKNTDASYVQSGSSAVITDIRLIGETDYPVRCSQYGGDIPDSELTYDAVLGKVTIANMTLLNNEFIVIEAIGAVPTSGFNTILSDISTIKSVIEPILKGMIIPWPYKDSDRPIPTGFVEVLDWAGRVMTGVDASDDDYKDPGDIGGNKEVTLLTQNLPAINLAIPGSENGTSDGSHVKFAWSDNENVDQHNMTFSLGGTSDPIDIKPKFRTIRFIKWALA